MIESLKPGQTVRCTVLKAPRALGDRKTIQRLMWRDPDVIRGLRKSQKLRRRNTVVYNRGNRDWVQRLKCPRIIEVATGNTWQFTYSLDLANDVRAVREFLKIEAA